ncbi:hypothetical protein HRbin37_00341 [bacterium HR37]|nr:hypothetical protein HRbin37_00341 [bacterium HR37]
MKGRLFVVFFVIVLISPGSLAQDEENPHKEMIEDQFVCLDCHTKVPKEGEKSPTYFLVDLPSENCLGCHEELEHAGVKEHEGKDANPLPGDENGKIACFTCHDPHPRGVIKDRMVYEADVDERNRMFVRLVVLPDIRERINVEVKSKAKKEVYLRLPVSGNKLCITCHETVDKANWRRYITWDKFFGLFSY